MDKIDLVNPDRLLWCCEDRGITPKELAEELGIAWSTLEKVLAETGGFSFGQLRKIAQYFNRGVLFFLETEPVSSQTVHSPQFRTITNQKQAVSAKVRAIIERVEQQRDRYLSLREDLDDDEQLLFVPPSLPKRNLKRAASIAREWLQLEDERDFESYRRAVEAKGILVFRSNGYAGRWQVPKGDPVCGFSVYDPTCPAIFVKKESYDPRQTFTLMHELGHILLHRASFIDDEDDLYSRTGREREANVFAGHLLVPDSSLAQVTDEDRPVDPSDYREWLKPLITSRGVSVEVVLRRLLRAGRLEQAHLDRYREWAKEQPNLEQDRGSRQWRHREPRHVFGDTYVLTVLEALHEKQITLAKASTYLDNLKIPDVHMLEGCYAGT